MLELLKDATDTMLIGSGDYNEGKMLNRFLQELNDVIVRDPLTSLYNRRFLDERLPVDIIEATLMQMPLSVCFIDLDNFKLINDLYGHESGDLAIRAVSEVIYRNIRFKDACAARYGGDEFLIYFKNTDDSQTRVIAEHIQRDIEEISIDQLLKGARLSISYGIETMKETPMTAKELIRCADEKMYKAKKAKNSDAKHEC